MLELDAQPFLESACRTGGRFFPTTVHVNVRQTLRLVKLF